MRNLTWQQIAVLVVCLAAAFAAHMWLGLPEGMAAGLVTSIIAFLMGRGDPPEDPPAAKKPNLKAIGFSGAAVFALSLALPGCALFTSQNAKSVLDVVQVACIIANADSADAAIVQVCGIADVLIPDLKQILSAERTALAKAKKEAACKKAAK